MNQENTSPKKDNPTEKYTFAELARKVLLAGIGAAALAKEEAEVFIKKLIEKGELAEVDGRTILHDLKIKRQKKKEEFVEKRLTSIIDRLNLPTQSDYEALSKKLSELSKKIDEL